MAGESKNYVFLSIKGASFQGITDINKIKRSKVTLPKLVLFFGSIIVTCISVLLLDSLSGVEETEIEGTGRPMPPLDAAEATPFCEFLLSPSSSSLYSTDTRSETRRTCGVACSSRRSSIEACVLPAAEGSSLT